MRLELWASVGSDADRKLLRDYEERLPEVTITEAVAPVLFLCSLERIASGCEMDQSVLEIDVLVHQGGMLIFVSASAKKRRN